MIVHANEIMLDASYVSLRSVIMSSFMMAGKDLPSGRVVPKV
jgi:hypothetical protein